MKRIWDNLTCHDLNNSVLVLGWVWLYALLHIGSIVAIAFSIRLITAEFFSLWTGFLLTSFILTFILLMKTFQRYEEMEKANFR